MQVVKCSKRGALVHKNSLASCQRCRHSVELHALTCPFEQNNLNALSLLSGHPTNTYLLRETLLWVGPNQEYSIINNQFSISLARRSTFCKFQNNLEIPFMDMNGDLDWNYVPCGTFTENAGIVTGKWIENCFLVIIKFHKMSQMSHQISQL